MSEIRLYISRHGKTMFNTIGRVQGWCDTPLTQKGEEGIRELGLGLKEANIDFKLAVSSDLGRTVQTMTIALRELGELGKIPYYQDKRIREWCFGSFEGMYDAELFQGVLPRLKGTVDTSGMSFAEIATGIQEADTAGWTESWEVLSNRILAGFESIAQDLEKQGGGNALVVSHGMTIATLAHLLEPERGANVFLDNGSITVLKYEDGELKIEAFGDLSYRQRGAELIAQGK
ncbi:MULTISPECIES: histidine phosphatase family protein [Streptococcus]|uniref:Histidine phosphatase family protein n=1 Tax=Streptococcus ruminantium TaxID=1917441 RepID=A0A2Z5TN97_9STRE|nr:MULTISPECIES: histidine phosphatase family protein [Streptococcus]MDQ8759647.1 histidine phosphatase family protein [Streptococcus ruminantium]MDQ8765934.1 histidine phosphatase family protein [Streptococcus ruminantium]MDQ8767229.1 histidine phosphatase family protein [Streptococcus ruminantium]MDQ8768797.1 histidine phosphatase family protein [Streptococcus ruminantium]MDQ8774724.1 histidine phosphatase family protein [Streptococcus ruminantium]